MNDEQRGLREAVRTLLAKRSDVRTAIEAPGGYDAALWRVLCEQIGVAALAIPEQYGGAGAGMAEIQVVLAELGATLTPTPLLGSAVLAARTLLELRDPDACERLLPRIAAGEVAALAWVGADGAWTPADIACTADAGAITGTAHYVLDGDTADIVLVAARGADGVGVYEVDAAAVDRRHTPAMDLTRRLATLTFACVPGTRIGGSAEGALSAAVDAAIVALSAEQVGAAARILDRSVDYTKTRVQFGRPIGSFQALKHRMADLHVLVEAARSAAYGAADGSARPVDGEGVLQRGLPARRRRVHPAARWHRDHLGARRAAVLQAGARQRAPVRFAGRPPAPARRRGGPVKSQQELSDRLEINDLLVAYCYAIDFHQWDELDALFTRGRGSRPHRDGWRVR